MAALSQFDRRTLNDEYGSAEGQSVATRSHLLDESNVQMFDDTLNIGDLKTPVRNAGAGGGMRRSALEMNHSVSAVEANIKETSAER